MISSLNIVLSHTQTQASYFTPRASCHYFLPLRPPWRATVTLTSELTTGANTQDPAGTCPCVMVTSHLSVSQNHAVNSVLAWVPCSLASGLPILLTAKSGIQRGGVAVAQEKWDEAARCGSPNLEPCLRLRRHRRNEVKTGPDHLASQLICHKDLQLVLQRENSSDPRTRESS